MERKRGIPLSSSTARKAINREREREREEKRKGELESSAFSWPSLPPLERRGIHTSSLAIRPYFGDRDSPPPSFRNSG